MANVLNEAARELPCLVVKPEMLRNKQENKTYQNEQSGDAECHAPQPATGSRGCLFPQRGWLFHRGANLHPLPRRFKPVSGSAVRQFFLP
jgi:hypothetical protein